MDEKSLGQRLYELRKEKHLSQEEVAHILQVTRQTISKWETNQSTPDFDKIVPICELYNISANELIFGQKEASKEDDEIFLDNSPMINDKKAKGIAFSILLYFIAVIWLIVSIAIILLNPIIATALFLLICGIATAIIVYTCIVYPEEKNEIEKEKEKDKMRNQIENVLAIIVLIIYLSMSFMTNAWHITWIIWIIFGLMCEILKLLFMLKGDGYEE